MGHLPRCVPCQGSAAGSFLWRIPRVPLNPYRYCGCAQGSGLAGSRGQPSFCRLSHYLTSSAADCPWFLQSGIPACSGLQILPRSRGISFPDPVEVSERSGRLRQARAPFAFSCPPHRKRRYLLRRSRQDRGSEAS